MKNNNLLTLNIVSIQYWLHDDEMNVMSGGSFLLKSIKKYAQTKIIL